LLLVNLGSENSDYSFAFVRSVHLKDFMGGIVVRC
jgi:hypothetical protein